MGEKKDSEFNVIQFEKKLTTLKDTQECIQQLSAWCLHRRQHHKKIVTSWLNVLKRVKVEHRLTLFYLANDVIQYSKRKNFEFVESWGTTLQKATTMVRDDKVKDRIMRIFKIWEERAVYGEDFLGDLCGLLSAATGKIKSDDPSEFQSSVLISKLRQVASLEADTDKKLKILTERPLLESEAICTMLKDRRHVMDVEEQIEDNVVRIEAYVNALNAELRARNFLISSLEHAEQFYNTQRGEVKVVSNAYRNFGSRVKGLKRKLDEIIPTLMSPIPSPDINAPSPSPDSEIDLPVDDLRTSVGGLSDQSMYSVDHSFNQSGPNGFTSFMDGTMPFNISGMFGERSPKSPSPMKDSGGGKPIEVINLRPKIEEQFNITDFLKSLLPTTGPGISHTIPDYHPPVGASSHDTSYSNPGIPLLSVPGSSVPQTIADYQPPSRTPLRNTHVPYSNSPVAPLLPPPMPPAILDNSDQYVDSYQDQDPNQWSDNWNIEARPVETPESPPHYEQESLIEPVEYNDRSIGQMGSGIDVDHRILPPPPPPAIVSARLDMQDTDHRIKDIDHRNLISLTGSPGLRSSPVTTASSTMPMQLPPPPPMPPSWDNDQMYRNNEIDHDYRMPMLHNNVSVVGNHVRTLITNANAPVHHSPHRLNGAPLRALHSPRFNRPPPPPPPILSTAPANSGYRHSFHQNQNRMIPMENKTKNMKSPPPKPRFTSPLKLLEKELMGSNIKTLSTTEHSTIKSERNTSGSKQETGEGANMESIDMEMSDDEDNTDHHNVTQVNQNINASKAESPTNSADLAFDRLRDSPKNQQAEQNRPVIQTPKETAESQDSKGNNSVIEDIVTEINDTPEQGQTIEETSPNHRINQPADEELNENSLQDEPLQQAPSIQPIHHLHPPQLHHQHQHTPQIKHFREDYDDYDMGNMGNLHRPPFRGRGPPMRGGGVNYGGQFVPMFRGRGMKPRPFHPGGPGNNRGRGFRGGFRGRW